MLKLLDALLKWPGSNEPNETVVHTSFLFLGSGLSWS